MIKQFFPLVTNIIKKSTLNIKINSKYLHIVTKNHYNFANNQKFIHDKAETSQNEMKFNDIDEFLDGIGKEEFEDFEEPFV